MISQCILVVFCEANLESKRCQTYPVTECRKHLRSPIALLTTLVLSTSKIRKREVKQHGSLCTCLASRAVHIEVTDSLDTFLYYGFKMLHKSERKYELRDAVKEMNHEKIRDILQNNRADYMLFKFKRNPPASSHIGGVWERQICSVRMILSSLMRTHGLSLSGEAFRTFMAKVAAVFNSQPLTVENLSNPDDPPPLCLSQLITLKS